MICSVLLLPSAMVPSLSEHFVTTIKVLDSGSLYLFQKSSSGDASSWTPKNVATTELKASDGESGAYVGICVAISDGTIVTGLPKRTTVIGIPSISINSGAAYIWFRVRL